MEKKVQKLTYKLYYADLKKKKRKKSHGPLQHKTKSHKHVTWTLSEQITSFRSIVLDLLPALLQRLKENFHVFVGLNPHQVFRQVDLKCHTWVETRLKHIYYDIKIVHNYYTYHDSVIFPIGINEVQLFYSDNNNNSLVVHVTGVTSPPSLLRILLTAPEHPSQVMATSNSCFCRRRVRSG